MRAYYAENDSTYRPITLQLETQREFDALRFIARLTVSIPDILEQERNSGCNFWCRELTRANMEAILKRLANMLDNVEETK